MLDSFHFFLTFEWWQEVQFPAGNVHRVLLLRPLFAPSSCVLGFLLNCSDCQTDSHCAKTDADKRAHGMSMADMWHYECRDALLPRAWWDVNKLRIARPQPVRQDAAYDFLIQLTPCHVPESVVDYISYRTQTMGLSDSIRLMQTTCQWDSTLLCMLMLNADHTQSFPLFLCHTFTCMKMRMVSSKLIRLLTSILL
jgi:hypothetical protein